MTWFVCCNLGSPTSPLREPVRGSVEPASLVMMNSRYAGVRSTGRSWWTCPLIVRWTCCRVGILGLWRIGCGSTLGQRSSVGIGLGPLEGGQSGAPKALQIADRWHIWHNLGKAVGKVVTAHHSAVRAALNSQNTQNAQEAGPGCPAAARTAAVTPGLLDVGGNERRLVIRTRERFEAVQQLLCSGASLGQICLELGLDRGAVQRFARAKGVEELLVAYCARREPVFRCE
jgi:hypothetical protein